MNIGINTRLLLKNRLEGIGRFSFESLKELVKLRPNDQFFFFFDRAFDPKFVFANNITPIVVGPPTRHPILWYIWFDYQLPRLFKTHQIELFLSPDGYLSLKTDVKQLTVLHDINFIHNENLVKGWAGRYFRSKFPKFAHKAERLLTVSQFCVKDISEHLAVPETKIDVCYNGISSVFLDAKPTKHPRKKPFFLFYGALNPRKNLEGLFQAFDTFKTNHPSDYELIIIGKKMNWTQEMQSSFEAMKHKNEVIFMGRLADEELISYLQHAQALTFVSLFEGFGIPIIEAQAVGCPVICSNTSALPEIAGEAAHFVNPKSTEEIAKALHLLSSDEKYRTGLIQKGKENYTRFSWLDVAKRINQSIDMCLC
ncbi:MAG: glycosyltransferase family 4 protein [Flavobacteriales bacterium]